MYICTNIPKTAASCKALGSLLAAFFSLMGCAVQTFSFLFYIAPLVVLQDAPHLSAFKAEQFQAMALMLFKLYVKASNIGSAFFGFYCLLIGYLVFRSAFFASNSGCADAVCRSDLERRCCQCSSLRHV